MIKENRITAVSLFAGIGGIDLGFIQAGIEVILANDNNKAACKTYKHNFPKTDIVECDIAHLDVHTIDKSDIITAGFPCQSFSVCGRQQGFNDSRGHTFFEIMRLVDKLSPRVIFLENVANLAEHDNGKTFNTIHNEIISRGYLIRYMIGDACDYGIPQHRTRIYIVAFKHETEINKFSFPEKSVLNIRLSDIIDRSVQADFRYYERENTKIYRTLINSIKDSEQLYRFTDYGIQSSKDSISFTLKANMGTWYNRIPYLKDSFGIRKLTPEECLAIQGFPKSFAFPADISLKEQYKQAGNTVVVPLIKKIATNIVTALK